MGCIRVVTYDICVIMTLAAIRNAIINSHAKAWFYSQLKLIHFKYYRELEGSPEGSRQIRSNWTISSKEWPLTLLRHWSAEGLHTCIPCMVRYGTLLEMTVLHGELCSIEPFCTVTTTWTENLSRTQCTAMPSTSAFTWWKYITYTTIFNFTCNKWVCIQFHSLLCFLSLQWSSQSTTGTIMCW